MLGFKKCQTVRMSVRVGVGVRKSHPAASQAVPLLGKLGLSFADKWDGRTFGGGFGGSLG